MAVSDYFVWGKGGAKLTPEQIERQREIENRLASGGIDTSPVGHPLQGLARVAQAMAGAVRRGQLDKASADIDTYNTDTYGGLSDNIFGASQSAAPGEAAVLPRSDIQAEISASAPGSMEAQPSAVAGDLPPYATALLDTIAGPESAGKYNVIYGGSHFDDFSDHPRKAVPIGSGPNKGRTSSAAGKYQFLGSTWDDQAKKLGLTDFSPGSQDKAAWNLARESYQRSTGGDLDAVLQSGDPQAIAEVGRVLNPIWTSLPGGIEAGTNTNRFVSAFNSNLGRGGAASAIEDIAPTAYVDPMVSAATPKGITATAMLGGSGQQPMPIGQQAVADAMPEQETVLDPIQAQADMQPAQDQWSGMRQADPMAGQGVQVADASGFMPGGTAQGEGMQRQRVARALQERQLAQAGQQPQTGQQIQQPVTAAQGTDERAVLTQAIRALSDPRANDRTRLVAKTLIDREMKKQAALEEQQIWEQRKEYERAQQEADPVRRQQLEKGRLEIDAMRNPVSKPTSDIQEYEYARSQGYEGNFANFQQEMKKAGASSTNVNVGEGDKFYENLDKKNAETFAAMSDSGIQARAKMAQLDRLEGLMKNAPQGGMGALKQAAGEWGFATAGTSDIQAVTAMLEKMVPEQRMPGSGPMSDADIKMFRASLPRIINQVGGNQLIMQTMRGIAQYEMQMGEIADKVADREISPADGRRMIRELKNPLADFKIPEGTTPNEGWKELSPGVKFKKKGE